MGTSKGVLLSGVALVVGMYTVAIKKADRLNAEAVETRTFQLQSEDIARTGLRFAVRRLEIYESYWSLYTSPSNYSKTLDLFGGTLTYVIEPIGSPGYAKITATGVFNGKTATVVANVKESLTGSSPSGWQGNVWSITKDFTTYQ